MIPVFYLLKDLEEIGRYVLDLTNHPDLSNSITNDPNLRKEVTEVREEVTKYLSEVD